MWSSCSPWTSGVGVAGAPLVHYCWREDGQPCCQNLGEARDKLAGAYLDLFLCHGMPVATLSRWAHVRVVCGILCTAFACRDVYVQALLQGLPADEAPEQFAEQRLPAAAAGAGDEDKATVHRARVSKVRRWLSRPSTRWRWHACT